MSADLKLVYVNDGVPLETTELIRAACKSRGVVFNEVYAPEFDFRPESQLRGGELLFRPAVSIAAIRVEQFLYTEGVATLYEPASALYLCGTSPIVFQRSGLPIPRTINAITRDRNLLKSHVDHLGGFPLVVKIPGYSRGVGVIRVDSLSALYSLIDYLSATGISPSICTYIPDADHWRVTVVGDRVVSGYKNLLDDEDFRSYASEDSKDYCLKLPIELGEIARKAVKLINVEFGGVDILVHQPSGRPYLLEVNFPAYFANAQLIGKHDIAGAIVDHLVMKSKKSGIPVTSVFR